MKLWVTFDCFGTLVDWNKGFANALKPLVGSRTQEVLRAYHEFERKLEAERPHRLFKEILADALALAAASVGVQLSSADAVRLTQSWASLPGEVWLDDRGQSADSGFRHMVVHKDKRRALRPRRLGAVDSRIVGSETKSTLPLTQAPAGRNGGRRLGTSPRSPCLRPLKLPPLPHNTNPDKSTRWQLLPVPAKTTTVC